MLIFLYLRVAYYYFKNLCIINNGLYLFLEGERSLLDHGMKEG